jgi:hypothetical protein
MPGFSLSQARAVSSRLGAENGSAGKMFMPAYKDLMHRVLVNCLSHLPAMPGYDNIKASYADSSCNPGNLQITAALHF